MYHFEHVTRNDAKPYRDEFEDIINEVQNIVRPYFTFSFRFIGSSARNMITYDPTTNIGFDFDVNLYVNDDNEDYNPYEIKQIIIDAINKVARPRGFQPCEDSTRVITLKKINNFYAKINYSCDFAIVNDYEDKYRHMCQQYIRFNKNYGTYTWEQQPGGYNLESKVNWIKANNLWDDVLRSYINKKNNRSDLTKKSRALYAETINEICQQNWYEPED